MYDTVLIHIQINFTSQTRINLGRVVLHGSRGIACL
jgi:hypothetical protein